MKEVNTLLQKIYRALNREKLERETVSNTLKENIGVEILPQNIFIHDGIIEITSSPAVKNEIKLKEEILLSALKNANISSNRLLYK